MNNIIMDFKKIKERQDFYKQLKEKCGLPEYFGYNLDALWDTVVSGELGFPVTVIFQNFNKRDNEFFKALYKLFKDAEKETNGKVIFKTSRGEK